MPTERLIAPTLGEQRCPDRALTVLPRRQELMFRDGSAVTLYAVQLDDEPGPNRFLRAFVLMETHIVVFDLRDLSPALRESLAVLPERDVPQVVFVTLRALHQDADAFTEAVVSNVHHHWMAPDAAPAPQPSRRHFQHRVVH